MNSLMAKIKIIYIIEQLGKGGAERQLFELLKGINKYRYKPIVVSLTQGGYWYERIRKLDIEIIQLPRIGHLDFSRLIKLVKLFRIKKPVIAHTFMFTANSYGRIAALIAGIPIIIASERSSYEIGKNKKRHEIYIDKLLASFTSGIICNSLNTSKLLTKNHSFKREKVYTVNNGIRIDKFSKKVDFEDQKKIALKVVGTVGNLTVPKNYPLFLDVARILLENYKNSDLKFLIVGEGHLKDELKKYSQDLGIDGKVIFTGSRDDVPILLLMMDIFVLSSNWEGLSNAITEAMASGLPCVVTDVGGNSELVIGGETGYLVPPNDPKELAQKISYLLKDSRLAKQMGRAGKERVLKKFSLRRMVRKTEKIYEKLINF